MQATRTGTRPWLRWGRGTAWMTAAAWSFAVQAVPVQGDFLGSKQGQVSPSSITDPGKPGEAKDGAYSSDTGQGETGRSDGAVEEVIVTGERLRNLTTAERRDIYRQLARGRSLYSRSQYKRAFPLLLNTAEHGFKDAQARVGYIYLQGLGEVQRDSSSAIGWLGVAASGNSAPGIENYFNDIWSRIPEDYVPYFKEVVEDYESRYGEKATGVTCEMRRPAGSHMKKLSCYFERDLTLEELDLIEDLFKEVTATQVPAVRQPPEQPGAGPPVGDESE